MKIDTPSYLVGYKQKRMDMKLLGEPRVYPGNQKQS